MVNMQSHGAFARYLCRNDTARKAIRWRIGDAAIAAIMASAIVRPAMAAPVFTIQTPPALIQSGNLTAVSAASASEAWAAGSVLAHWNGATWTPFAIPVANAVLEDVTDIASNDAWAVGILNQASGGTAPNTVALHWDGISWSEVATPPVPNGGAFFTSVTSVASDDAWIAGWQAAPDGEHINSLFEHWNGTAWSIVPATVAVQGFYEVEKISADSANDIWAVGRNGESTPTVQPFSFHWNGTTWSQVTVPQQPVGGELDGVVALSPTNVWAVGSFTGEPIRARPESGSASPRNPTATLTEHWNGKAWSVVASPNLGPTAANQNNHLKIVVALSPTDLWVAGYSAIPDGLGSVVTFALHGDGTSWTLQPTPDVSLSSALTGAAVAQPSTVWFVGAARSPGTFGAPFIVNTNGG